MGADILIKPLDRTKFEKFKIELGLVDLKILKNQTRYHSYQDESHDLVDNQS